MKHVFTLLAFALMSSGLAQVPEYVPADGLVAWYPLDGNALDEHSGQLHGDASEPIPTDNRNQELASALFFDGANDRITLPNFTQTEFGLTHFSVNAWVFLSEAKRHWVISNYKTANGNSTVLALGSEVVEGEAVLHVDIRHPLGDSNFLGANSIGLNEWHMVSLIRNGDMVTLFLDGEEDSISELALESSDLRNGWPFHFGMENGNGQFWHGRLDDIGLWDRALSTEEIQTLYYGFPPILGCTDPGACNYNSAATADAGNCLILDVCGECGGDNSTCVGCTDPEACNFDPAAVIDSEEESSCTYPADGQTCDDLCVLALPDTIVQCFNSSTLIEAGVQRGTFFDGVDDWILTSESGVTGMNPMSVSFWALTDHNGAMDIFTQATDEDSWADIRFGMNTPQCGLVGPSFKSPAHFATFPYPVDNRNWHHYAYVLGDGSMSFSNLKIYVDGELHAASTGEEFCGHNWGGWTYDAADVPIRFGVGLPLGGFYSGYLDDMALWSKALSQNEVFEIMANDALVVSEDLVSFWPLDQLEDGLFLDMVGNNHGAPVGGVGTETPLPQGVISWFNGSQMPNLVVTPNQTTAYSIQSVLESGQVCPDTTVVEVIDFEYADLNGNGICDQLEGEGCMDPVACNYSEFALVDDGSCDFSCCPGPGCCISPNVWDPATQMCVNTAASCGEGTVWDESLQQCLPEDMCFADLDNDGVVGMADLLDLLTQFGFECAE